MLEIRFPVWLAIVASSGAAFDAAAQGMLGATVSYTGYCCDAPVAADAATNTAAAVVGAGIEFPGGSIFGPGVVDSQTDISATQIVTTVYTSFPDTRYEPGDFDGGVATFSGPSFTRFVSVVVDPASTFFPVRVWFTDNLIFQNSAGLPFRDGDVTILDVAVAPVPEPATAWLMALGAVGVLTAVRASGRRCRVESDGPEPSDAATCRRRGVSRARKEPQQ